MADAKAAAPAAPRWPGETRAACAFTFDMDAETLWMARDIREPVTQYAVARHGKRALHSPIGETQAGASGSWRVALLVAAILGWFWPLPGAAKACDKPDDPGWVTGANECLVVRAFASPGDLSSPVLVVMLHGDVSSGGPAKYHMTFAQQLAEGSKNLVAVARCPQRPG